MAFDVNVTSLNRRFEMDSSSNLQKTSSHFPVIPVAVSLSLFFVLFALALILYTIRRRRRYHDYTAVDKGPIKPEILETIQAADKAWGLMASKASSEDSLAPVSSEDELDKEDASHDQTPLQAEEEEEEEEIYPEGHIGRVWFSTAYDFNRESLTIVLHKIKHLPDRSEAMKYCDPGVKISLLPKQHLAQSRYKRKNKNPVFNEKFEVNLPSYELQSGTLCLQVFDGYRANQQTLIGHVLYPLKQLDTTNVNELERDLTKPVEESASIGQLHVSLSYYPSLHRLTAIVLRATNLKKLTHRQTDSYVKIAFSIGNKVMKTKKTVVHTETQSPMYNESFNFTINEDDLGTSTIMITVMHSGGGIVEDKPVGRVLLGGRMYARGRACDQWLDMMNSPRKMVKCWHELQAF